MTRGPPTSGPGPTFTDLSSRVTPNQVFLDQSEPIDPWKLIKEKTYLNLQSYRAYLFPFFFLTRVLVEKSNV